MRLAMERGMLLVLPKGIGHMGVLSGKVRVATTTSISLANLSTESASLSAAAAAWPANSCAEDASNKGLFICSTTSPTPIIMGVFKSIDINTYLFEDDKTLKR